MKEPNPELTRNNKRLRKEPTEQKKQNSSSEPKTLFYEKVLDEVEKLDFETAAGAEGLDDEITLIRVKIKTLLKDDPDNLKMIMAGTDMLAKLVKTRYKISQGQKQGLGEAIKNMIKDIGVPLGVAVLNKKL